jgi:citrate lyase subunit beta/citryl-CoA lyase
MRLRSLLFVPGDRPERAEKVLASGADALILDLEDSVAPGAKPSARQAVATFLRAMEHRELKLFVRINPLGGAEIGQDLSMLAGTKPDGIVLPKAEGQASVAELVGLMRERGLTAPILPIATETAAAIFQLGTYAAVAPCLAGLTWGAEDLPAAIGATTSRETDGRYTPPYELARALTLFGAHAAGIPAIETVFPAFRDLEGLAAYAERARRDGFSGMMAIHPTQVVVINEAFTPSAAELEYARAVVAAFAGAPGAGALQLEGKMIDAPHLKQARATLERADPSRVTQGGMIIIPENKP